MIGGSNVTIDTDFRWMGHISFLANRKRGTQHIFLVAGSDSLVQALKVIYLTKVLKTPVSITLVIHPLLHIQDVRSNLSKKGIGEYLVLYKEASVARAFLALGLQWSSYRSTVKSSELYLVQQSLSRNVEFSGQKRESYGADFIKKYLQRNALLKTLKHLRAGNSPTEEQKALLQAVCP